MKLLDNMEAFRFHISIIYDPTLESLLDRVISHECGRVTSRFIARSLLCVPPRACVCVGHKHECLRTAARDDKVSPSTEGQGHASR